MRHKRWIPLVLIWLGFMWLVQLGVAQAGGAHGVWVIGERMDLGVLDAGEVAQASVTIVNLSVRGLEVEAMPSCGCTVLEEARFVLGAFGWRRVSVRVETGGGWARGNMARCCACGFGVARRNGRRMCYCVSRCARVCPLWRW